MRRLSGLGTTKEKNRFSWLGPCHGEKFVPVSSVGRVSPLGYFTIYRALPVDPPPLFQ